MFGIWIGPTAGLVATNHHLWRLAHHTCSSLKVVSLTWYCKSSTKVRMWCRTKSKLHAWETHSRTMIGHCKWWASRRTFGRVWALSSSPPAWLPARLYGWHAIPDNKTPGFWTAFHIPSKASLEPTSQQTTGIPGWTNSRKCASFGWCSTAQAYWKSHAWNPTAVAPRPAQTSTAVVSRWKSKGTCERTLQPSSIHKAIFGAGARTKESTNVCLPQTSLPAPTNLTNWPEGQIVASPTPLSMAKTSTTTVTRDPTIAWDQSGAYKWRTGCAKPCDMTNKVKTDTQTSASATLPELTGIWARAIFKHQTHGFCAMSQSPRCWRFGARRAWNFGPCLQRCSLLTAPRMGFMWSLGGFNRNKSLIIQSPSGSTSFKMISRHNLVLSMIEIKVIHFPVVLVLPFCRSLPIPVARPWCWIFPPCLRQLRQSSQPCQGPRPVPLHDGCATLWCRGQNMAGIKRRHTKIKSHGMCVAHIIQKIPEVVWNINASKYTVVETFLS